MLCNPTDNVFAHIWQAWSKSPDLHSSLTPETRFGAYIIFIVAQRPFDGPPFAWLRIHSRAHHPHAYIVLQYLSSQTRVWFAVVNLATSAAWNEYISLSAKIDVNFLTWLRPILFATVHKDCVHRQFLSLVIYIFWGFDCFVGSHGLGQTEIESRIIHQNESFLKG